jgi:hypothetical protein
LTAQNLESIGKEKAVSLTGGLSFNQIFYSATGVESRRDPYSYFASGNLSFSLIGWSIPLSFNLSNQTTSFSQPFNQYSLHPTYKSVTVHAGYTSMTFSPYTVSGHLFLGGGVDVEPQGNWKFSALYGRFLKAVPRDTASENSFPSYERRGYGLKTSYNRRGNSIHLIIFRAADDESSIAQPPDSVDLAPQENLVVSIGAGKTIFKHFLLKAELATSGITRDMRSEKMKNDHWLANTAALFESRLSSAFHNAFKTSLDYQHKQFIIGLGYEKVDPQYRTLGAYYFNNDLENITVNGSAGILEGKLNISTSVGTQRDNLDKTKVSTMRRLVGSFNLNYMPSPKANLSASYSTFQTYTNIRSQFADITQLTPYENLDTLDFTQISKNASLSGIYTLSARENIKQNVSIHLTYQDAADKQGQVEQHSGSRFYNVNTSYSINFLPRSTSVVVSFNGSLNESQFQTTKVFGPSLAISSAFLKRKMRTSVSSSFNKTHNGQQNNNEIINYRGSATMAVKKNHNVNFSAVMVKRRSAREGNTKSFTECTATLGYSYSFGTN